MKNAIFGFAVVLGLASTPAMAATFSSLDENSDSQISKDEFYGSVADAGIYSDWDADSDGLINESEFDAFDYDWDYTAWDVNEDGYIDSGEFYDTYYVTYDADENGHWDNGEWDDAGEAGLFDW